MSKRPPGSLDGADSRPERPSIAAALRMVYARPGPPTENDRPPPSLFPMTPAARAALDLRRHK